MHHEAVSSCHRAISRQIHDVSSLSLHSLVQSSLLLENPPMNTQQDQQSMCKEARKVVALYNKRVRQLKKMVDEGFSGVCLRCFRAETDQEACGHDKHKTMRKDRPRTPEYEIDIRGAL